MTDFTELNVDGIARIGLIYLDGDLLENVLLDKFGHTDYIFKNFNELKKSLVKMERINPGLRLTAILWQLRPDNDELVVPVVAGNALPFEGWKRTKTNNEIKNAYNTGLSQVKKRSDTCFSHYYPVKNSDAEIVGVLELIKGERSISDI